MDAQQFRRLLGGYARISQCLVGTNHKEELYFSNTCGDPIESKILNDLALLFSVKHAAICGMFRLVDMQPIVIFSN